MDAQQYVDEEEDLGDSAADENRDQGGWFKRRSTQISPEGKLALEKWYHLRPLNLTNVP